MNRFDWKSVLAGFLLALLIFFGLGAANQKKGEESAKKPESPVVGRFQMVALGDARIAAVMVLDTATGEVWYAVALDTPPPPKEFLAPRIKGEKYLPRLA
jgi:hypothetical protein